jgi:hypothetical protein
MQLPNQNFPSIPAGDTQQITFSWTAEPGKHILKVDALLPEDQDLSNNAKETEIDVTEIGFSANAAVISVGQAVVRTNISPPANVVINGSGSGPIAYKWITEKPDGTKVESIVLSAFLNGGQITINNFVNLPAAEPGIYNTSLQITAPNNITSNTANYTVNALPIAAYSYNPSNPQPGQQITFDASNSSDADGNITTYNWSFGDNNNQAGTLIQHTFDTPGTKVVILTVTDNYGMKDSEAKEIHVGTNVTVSGATANLPSSTVSKDGAISVSGNLAGTGSGNIQYKWKIQRPSGTTIESNVFSTFMVEGAANVNSYTLPTDQIGQHSAVLSVLLPNTLDSSPATYTVETIESDNLLFTDDFEAGPSPLWIDEFDEWIVENGAYRPIDEVLIPGPIPFVVSSLPFELQNFEFGYDVNFSNPAPGNNWTVCLRCDNDSIFFGFTPIGVGLQIGDSGGIWFATQDEFSPPIIEPIPPLSQATGRFRVRADGNTYSLFEGDDPTPISTFTDDSFTSGVVAIGQGLNFEPAPLPPAPAQFDNIELYALQGTPLNTPAGPNVVVQPIDPTTQTAPAQLSFNQVDVPGTSSLQISGNGPVIPGGTSAGTVSQYYDLNTTAQFSGAVEVCLGYDEANFNDEDNLGLHHYSNNSWTEITTQHDTGQNQICGDTQTLSPFIVLENVPLPPPATGLFVLDQTYPIANSGSNDGVRGIDKADFDLDGDTDLVAVELNGEFPGSQDLMTVFYNDGTGHFTSSSFNGGDRILDVVTGDFNNDGRPDVATGFDNNSGSSGQVRISLNQSPGTSFAAPVGFNVGSRPMTIDSADLNGDNKPDIVTGNGSGSVSVLLNNGQANSLGFQALPNILPGGGAGLMKIAFKTPLRTDPVFVPRSQDPVFNRLMAPEQKPDQRQGQHFHHPRVGLYTPSIWPM